MSGIRTTRQHIDQSPIESSLRRSRRPATAAQTALRNSIQSRPLPGGSTSPSAIPSSSYSSFSTSEDLSGPRTLQQSPLPAEAGLLAVEKPPPGRSGDPHTPKKAQGIYIETPPARLSRRLHAVLEEAEAARIRNKFDECESVASSISFRAKRRFKGTVMARKAKKMTRGPAQGGRVLRGKSTGTTKNKKASRKVKPFSRLYEGENLEFPDVDMADCAATQAGGLTDVSMKDPSPGSGDVSMRDADANSPEVNTGGNKGETPMWMTAIDMVRGTGRHFAIFVAAVQDSTNDLRDSGEYKAWREFFGKL
ncbi:hypothetical protein HOY80DRAFT_1098986 [Tuber brumale]|nr:hypothetical protein HOY80DRAFT_1098986 [Tuber brumale]